MKRSYKKTITRVLRNRLEVKTNLRPSPPKCKINHRSIKQAQRRKKRMRLRIDFSKKIVYHRNFTIKNWLLFNSTKKSETIHPGKRKKTESKVMNNKKLRHYNFRRHYKENPKTPEILKNRQKTKTFKNNRKCSLVFWNSEESTFFKK